MNEQIQVRIKTLDDIGKDWEKISPLELPMYNLSYLIDVLQNDTNVYEVRWNEMGNPQGHYLAIKKGTKLLKVQS